MSVCLCPQVDYRQCQDQFCKHAGTGRPDYSDVDDEPETRECASCSEAVSLEETRSHGEDYDLCPKCSAGFIASVLACHHSFDHKPTVNEHGDEGLVCHRCGVFIEPDIAMNWFPFICDGFVEMPYA